MVASHPDGGVTASPWAAIWTERLIGRSCCRQEEKSGAAGDRLALFRWPAARDRRATRAQRRTLTSATVKCLRPDGVLTRDHGRRAPSPPASSLRPIRPPR